MKFSVLVYLATAAVAASHAVSSNARTDVTTLDCTCTKTVCYCPRDVSEPISTRDTHPEIRSDVESRCVCNAHVCQCPGPNPNTVSERSELESRCNCNAHVCVCPGPNPNAVDSRDEPLQDRACKCADGPGEPHCDCLAERDILEDRAEDDKTTCKSGSSLVVCSRDVEELDARLAELEERVKHCLCRGGQCICSDDETADVEERTPAPVPGGGCSNITGEWICGRDAVVKRIPTPLPGGGCSNITGEWICGRDAAVKRVPAPVPGGGCSNITGEWICGRGDVVKRIPTPLPGGGCSNITGEWICGRDVLETRSPRGKCTCNGDVCLC